MADVEDKINNGEEITQDESDAYDEAAQRVQEYETSLNQLNATLSEQEAALAETSNEVNNLSS